jgi:hypothetical protein
MERLDYFNTTPGLSYNGNRYFRSKVGGGFFIFISVLVFVVFVIFSKRFVEREKPKMTLEDQKYWNPPPINLQNHYDEIF